jgi:hypothetical protein
MEIKNKIEYEIHVAADVNGFGSVFADSIYKLGFIDDPLVKRGVVFSDNTINQTCCPLIGLHVTWSSYDKNNYKNTLAKLDSYLSSNQEKNVGYAHAEVIRPEWDINIEFSSFRKGHKFPFRKFQCRHNLKKTKNWDIHISAKLISLDCDLYNTLFKKAGMYYIDLKKGSDVYRIFTIQGTSSPKHGKRVFFKLKEFLNKTGGMEGSIKFEQLCYWKQFGNSVLIPPTLENTEEI